MQGRYIDLGIGWILYELVQGGSRDALHKASYWETKLSF